MGPTATRRTRARRPTWRRTLRFDRDRNLPRPERAAEDGDARVVFEMRLVVGSETAPPRHIWFVPDTPVRLETLGDVLTVDEVALVLRCSVRTVRRKLGARTCRVRRTRC